MSPANFPTVGELTRLQIEAVGRWHRQPLDNPYDGFASLVCAQHECNFRLWHEEDKARNPSATDHQIADVKRAIDRLNQSRNDMIERIDDSLAEILSQTCPIPDSAPVNTETPGSAIDRLSIMALRMFHYREQLNRPGIDANHRETVTLRIATCEQQHTDLATSLQQLMDDLFAGRKCHKTYRQLKMYNDSKLNPEIYGSGEQGGLSGRG